VPGRVKIPPPGGGPPGLGGGGPPGQSARTGGTGATPAFQPTKSTGTTPALQPNRATGTTGTSPALPADRFGEASKLVSQLSGRDVVRAPGQLTSNLGGVLDATLLPDRLNADLAIHLPELVSLLSLTRQQKAARLVEFLAPYAAKLAELTHSAALPASQRVQLEEKLLTPMANAGLDQVVELTTGKSGVEVAKEMLSAETPEQVMAHTEGMSFDAPTWASRPEVALANEVKRGEPSLIAQPNPTIQPLPERAINGRGNVDDEPQKKDRSDRVLGKNMVWNVLHMFRDTGEAPMDEKQKKEMLLATGGIIVLVITVGLVVALTLILGK
jgi:hypothetical protein